MSYIANYLIHTKVVGATNVAQHISINPGDPVEDPALIEELLQIDPCPIRKADQPDKIIVPVRRK